MASEDLIPVRSTDEAKKRGRNGGIKSGEARRKKRDIRDRLKLLLELEREDMEGADALALALFERALSGDIRAIEVCLAVIGESPKRTATFPLKKIGNAADAPMATAALLRAVATGKLSPDDAQKIASLAALHLRAVEIGELAQRISALEEGRK